MYFYGIGKDEETFKTYAYLLVTTCRRTITEVAHGLLRHKSCRIFLVFAVMLLKKNIGHFRTQVCQTKRIISIDYFTDV